MGEKRVFSQSENHFLHIPAGENWFDRFKNVSFPLFLLFWPLSLSPVWPNIEGRQDLIYKTRPTNTNLIAVHWLT